MIYDKPDSTSTPHPHFAHFATPARPCDLGGSLIQPSRVIGEAMTMVTSRAGVLRGYAIQDVLMPGRI